MRKNSSLLLIGLVICSLLSLSPISETKAIEFNATSFHFFIDEPTNITYPDMVFSVKNNEHEPIIVNCTYETFEGINLSVSFAWESCILQPDEQIQNEYAIFFSSEFSSTYTVRIYIATRKLDQSGNQATTGGIIANKVTLFSQSEGSFLDLKVQDQSGEPRIANISIRYRPTVNDVFTPVKYLVDSWYQGYLPNGYYRVSAFDLEVSNIYAETDFELTADSSVNLELELIGFRHFKYVTSSTKDFTFLGINGTIVNNLNVIHNVRIYGELFFEGELISNTSVKYESQLAKTNFSNLYSFTMWFDPFSWNIGSYEIKGYIYSYEDMIDHKELDFTKDWLQEVQENPEQYFGYLMFSIAVLGYVALYIRRKRQVKPHDKTQ